MTLQSGSVKGLCIAFTYGVCSASMAFANKAVLSTFNYDYPILLVTIQMLFTILLLEFLRVTKILSLQKYTLETGRTFMLPSFFYALHSVLALWALSGMNIPMYGVIKRCAPLLILLLGTTMLGKGVPNARITSAVAMMTGGCIIAGFGDLAFDLECYVMGFASVISQSLYLILVQRNPENLSAKETLYLNSYNTFPLLLIASLLFGEFSDGLAAFQTNDVTFLFMFTLVIVMGTLLNYLLFLCTVYNSALTTSVTGTLKSIIQTAIGMFTFGGISLNLLTVTGIILNLSGGMMYSYAKYEDNQRKLIAKSKSTAVFEKMEEGNLNNTSSAVQNGGYLTGSVNGGGYTSHTLHIHKKQGQVYNA